MMIKKREKTQETIGKKVEVAVEQKNLQVPGIKPLRSKPPAPVTVTETPEPAMPSGIYRPPGARLTTTRKMPQGPPEIYSDTQFPSLQPTAKHVESRNRDKEMEKSFEVVRHKNRGREEVSKNQALKLQLDNQSAVLENQKYSPTQYS